MSAITLHNSSFSGMSTPAKVAITAVASLVAAAVVGLIGHQLGFSHPLLLGVSVLEVGFLATLYVLFSQNKDDKELQGYRHALLLTTLVGAAAVLGTLAYLNYSELLHFNNAFTYGTLGGAAGALLLATALLAADVKTRRAASHELGNHLKVGKKTLADAYVHLNSQDNTLLHEAVIGLHPNLVPYILDFDKKHGHQLLNRANSEPKTPYEATFDDVRAIEIRKMLIHAGCKLA